jgi:uncharacterized protein (DUF302 family)
MDKSFAVVVLAAVLASPAFAAEGLVSVDSPYDVATTADRLVSALEEKGMKIVARVNHASGAESVDLELEPTELVIFGNPKVGTPLMQCERTVAIDLPQKALIWEDEQGVHLAYNDPAYLASRHNIGGCDEVLEKVSKALANFAATATAP